MKPMTPIEVELEDGLLASLEMKAQNEQCTLEELIVDILDRHIEEEGE